MVKKGDIIREVVDLNFENFIIEKGREFIVKDVGIFYNSAYIFDENSGEVINLDSSKFEII